MNPKLIPEWGLDKKSLKIVKKNITAWMEHFGKQSDMRFTDNKLKDVNRFDLIKMRFFFFTDCRDLISKEVESKGVENNLIVRRRKRAKMLTLIFSTLLGNDHNAKIKCTHCGYPEKIIDGFDDGSGHFIFCPKCGLTSLYTYPPYYDTCLSNLSKKLAEYEVEIRVVNDNNENSNKTK